MKKSPKKQIIGIVLRNKAPFFFGGGAPFCRGCGNAGFDRGASGRRACFGYCGLRRNTPSRPACLLGACRCLRQPPSKYGRLARRAGAAL